MNSYEILTDIFSNSNYLQSVPFEPTEENSLFSWPQVKLCYI